MSRVTTGPSTDEIFLLFDLLFRRLQFSDLSEDKGICAENLYYNQLNMRIT